MFGGEIAADADRELVTVGTEMPFVGDPDNGEDPFDDEFDPELCPLTDTLPFIDCPWLNDSTE